MWKELSENNSKLSALKNSWTFLNLSDAYWRALKNLVPIYLLWKNNFTKSA